ncbi:hypothetical protein OF83DRAFT_1173494 [Amylostereum chailletii]|nr:hypothetical protein OF83DRAFT_1173494 [Amylostereum chailletii]
MSSTPSGSVGPPSQEEIIHLLAPIYLGALMSWFLFGVAAVQLYLYHVTPYGDRNIIKASVYIIFALDIFQSVIGLDMGWGVMIAGWGQVQALTYPGWTFAAIPAVSGIVAAWVQTFYAWRIHKLSQWKVFPVCIVVLAFAQASAALSVAVGAAPLKDVTGLHTITARICVWLGGSALVDSIISIVMVYLLFSVKKNSVKFVHSERKINRLIRLSVETGIATTATAVCDLVVFVAAINANYHAFFTLLMCKVYSNALLTSLNSRAVPHQQQTVAFASSALKGLASPLSSATHSVESKGSMPTVIHITSQNEVFRGDPEKQDIRGDDDQSQYGPAEGFGVSAS